MKQVHILCSKYDVDSRVFEIVGVYTNKNRAQAVCDNKNATSINIIYFVRTEVLL